MMMATVAGVDKLRNFKKNLSGGIRLYRPSSPTLIPDADIVRMYRPIIRSETWSRLSSIFYGAERISIVPTTESFSFARWHHSIVDDSQMSIYNKMSK